MSKVGRILTAITLAFAPALLAADMAHASCAYPGQEEAIAAAQQAETSSPTVVTIETCGGDDTSYKIPLSVDVTFDGQTYSDIYITTNSVITFGRPDGTYWTYPSTPSISLYSMDWVVYPGNRSDEHLIISSSDGGFQVDISARPIWLQNTAEPTNIVITAAILSDGTVAMAYSVDGPTYDGQTRTGVRLNDGTVVDFETYGIEQVSESPELAPEPTTESPFVEQPTESPTVSEEATESPTVSESATVSDSPELSTESATTDSDTASSEITESQTVSDSATASTQSPVSESNTISDIVDSSLSPVVLIVNEGETLSYVAPDGYKIDSVSYASYGDGDQCHAVDSQIIVESAITDEILTISATNDVFGDPCPGTYKRLEVVLVIQELPAQEEEQSTDSPTVSEQATTSSESVVVVTPEPTPEPSPEPLPSSPPPAIEPPVEPSPEPTQEPAPTPEPEPQPEPQPEPEPVVPEQVEPSEEPEPVVSDTPSPQPTPSPSETSKPVVQETKAPTPTPSPIITPSPTPSPTPTIIPEPEPVEPEKPTVEETINTVLTEIEDVSEITEEQKELILEQKDELIEATNEVFASADPGSEEYEEALAVLALIAEADDAELPEELAAIPLVGDVAGAVLEVFNDIGNVGADMSPQVRETSEKVVVASVIVANIAITATSAATSAAAVAARRP